MKIKIIACLLVFSILFIGYGKILRYILTDDTKSSTRITFHEMYEQDNIDILFVGSSHCNMSFVPEILDKEFCLNTFNAGTGSQLMDGSLMVIKEAARYNDISHIYLEVYYDVLAYDVRKNRTEMSLTYNIADYLKPSMDKFIYLIEASGSEYYMNSFVVARRNATKLLDLDYIKDILVKKSSDEYKNYGYSNITNTQWYYAGKGYIADNTVVNDWDYFTTYGWNNISLNVSDDWLNSLSDIIDFCGSKNIDLTLVAAPMSNFGVASVENYDEYIGLINDIIEGTDVDFYDFNLCREAYLPNTSSMFRDEHHLNRRGAETFSYCFAKLVNGEISPQDMFYTSYSEKLGNLNPTVFGVSYYDDTADDGTALRNCKIVSNDNENMDYEISIIPEEGEAYVVQEYSDKKDFVISPNEKGVCVIKYRMYGGIEAEYEVRLTLP